MKRSSGSRGRSANFDGFGGGTGNSDWLQLQWTVSDGKRVYTQHRFDRLRISWRPIDDVEVSVGRQAVSWGTTLFLTPADPFLPYRPTDALREFRSGIDAARFRRWALTDIGRLIGKDGKQISEAAGHHRQGEEPATPETHEERQRRLLSEAQEFTRLLSATYDARSEEEARAANKALDEYVEREAKNHETPEEQESQTHKRSRGQSISM